jgi:hypothetical protein
MTLEGIPPGPETEDVFGGWLEIAATVGQFVSALHLPGYRGASAVVNLLTALTAAQDGQTALLRSIKADTAALRMAPLKEALLSLEDARRVGPADSSWDTFIRRAEAKLSEARALVSGLQEEALVEYNLGIVYLAIGHQGNARHSLEQSAGCANRTVNEYVRKARSMIRDDRPDRLKRWELPKTGQRVLAGGAIAASMVTFGTYTLAYGGLKEATVNAARRRACHDLKDFLGFYNLIQHTASRTSGDAKPRYLTLYQTPNQPVFSAQGDFTTQGTLSGFQLYTLGLR